MSTQFDPYPFAGNRVEGALHPSSTDLGTDPPRVESDSVLLVPMYPKAR